jgi:ABC-type multidrug transport system ATPase subunit
MLHKLAHDKHKTIISTIHQPSSKAFNYFDRLMLMVDGHVVYQGACAKSRQYFDKIGYQVPKFSNPADFFLKLLSVNYPKTPDDE